MRSLRLLPFTLAVVLFTVSLAGCSHRVQVNLRPGDELKVQAAAVYPFTFRWPEPSYRSYELGELLAQQVAESGRYAVFGPGEFRLIRATSDNPFVGSDLALGLADRGLAPTEAIVFRPSAERRQQSAVKEVFDANGKPKGRQGVEETVLIVRLEVFHSASRELIADVVETVEVDPFAPREPSDPLPELTTALRKMMAATLESLETRAPGKPVVRDAGFSWVWNPKDSFDFSLEGRPSFNDELRKADPLTQDLLLDARMRFYDPMLDEPTVARLKRMPGGLLVTQVASAKAAGLLAGDLITQVNGEPALPQTLHRQLRAQAPGKSVAIKVRRSSGLVDLALPVAEPQK